MNHNIKPLSEFEKDWKKRIENPEQITEFMSTQAKAAFRLAMMRCADELQAWLREADKAALKLCEDDAYVANLFRYEILGTTRTEGEK